MLVVILGFVIFRADTLGQGFGMIRDMFTGASGDPSVNAQILSCISLLFLISFGFAILLSTPVFRVWQEKAEKRGHGVAFQYVSYSVSFVI